MYESHRSRPQTIARSAHRKFHRSFANQPDFRVQVVVRRMRCAPGGNVVSCTSNDSHVASLPFRTSRNCALFAVRTGKLSNGNIADGRELCGADGASTESKAGSSATGKTEHNSRRVTSIVSPRMCGGPCPSIVIVALIGLSPLVATQAARREGYQSFRI